ncbi:MAG: LamG domain-containing protein [Patescibacteria group bacterium]|nr:LamG domain-containing protein [Patescibacteria group bacterium]
MESFYFRTNGNVTFGITFYDNNGHHVVTPTIVSLGNGIYRAYATHTFESGATFCRTPDINTIVWGTSTYLDLDLVMFSEVGGLTPYVSGIAPSGTMVMQGEIVEGTIATEVCPTNTQNLVPNSSMKDFTGNNVQTVAVSSCTNASGVNESWNVTFGSNGATCTGSAGSGVYVGAQWMRSWKNGTIIVQCTWTTPSSIPSSVFLDVGINNAYQSLNNRYFFEAHVDGNNVYIAKEVNGSASAISSIVSMTFAPSTSYTFVLSRDPLGNFVGKVYQGVGTGGTLLATATVQDNSITGPWQMHVYGGGTGPAGFVVSGCVAKAPIPDGWFVNQSNADYDLEWYYRGGGPNNVPYMRLSLYDYSSASNNWCVLECGGNSSGAPVLAVADGTTYTFSAYAMAAVAGSPHLFGIMNPGAQYEFCPITQSIPTSWTRLSSSPQACPTGGAASGETVYLWPNVGSTVYLASPQLEVGSQMTPYNENDTFSSPYPLGRPAGTMDLLGEVIEGCEIGGSMLRVGVSYDGLVLSDLPVAYYETSESSGTSALDSSGNSQAGSYKGTVTLGQGSPYGVGGSSALFDGSTGYVDIPNSSVVSLIGFSASFEAWIKTAGSGTDMTILCKESSYEIALATGVFQIAIMVTNMNGNSPPNWGWIGSNHPINDGNWHHVVATYDGSKVQTYVDGERRTLQKNYSGNIQTDTYDVSIGCRGLGLAGPSSFFPGNITRVAIYNYALSPQQILSHYQIGLLGLQDITIQGEIQEEAIF